MATRRRQVWLLDDPDFLEELTNCERRTAAAEDAPEPVQLDPSLDTGLACEDTVDEPPASFLVPGNGRAAPVVLPPVVFLAAMTLLGASAAALVFHRQLMLLF